MGRTSNARARLVGAMAELVHQRGYRTVSVDDVCAAADVKKGSFYYFFGSKRELMLAALDMRWEMGRDRFLRVAFGRDAPPIKRIERFMEMVARAEAAAKKSGGRALGCPFGNLAAEIGQHEAALRKRVEAAFRGFRGFIQEALDDAVTIGDLPKGTDSEIAADAILAYFEGLALLARTRNDPALLRRLGARASVLALTELPRSALTRRPRQKRNRTFLARQHAGPPLIRGRKVRARRRR